MAFTDDIVAGTKLVRAAIQSPNYVPGISGWTINRDGTAEFTSVTTRGPVVVTQNGIVVASVGATGNISGQIGTFDDLIFNDDAGVPTSLAGLSGVMGRGLVGFHGTFSTPPNPGNGFYTNTGWFRAPLRGDRLYFVTATPLGINNSGFADARYESQWIISDTLNPAPGTFAYSTQAVVGGIGTGLVTSFLFATGGGAGRLATGTFVLQSRGSTANLSFSNPGGWNMMCFDVGSLAYAMNNGGVGTPAGATQRTTQYYCTASQSYNGSGVPISGSDGTNNVYQGDFSPTRPHGNERAILIFPGATIRSDLSGATVQSAKLYMYAFIGEETAGTLGYSMSTATSPPGTLSPGFSASYGYDDEWPLPGWHDVSMFDGGAGSALNSILSGNNSVVLNPTFFGLAATGFRGFGFSSALRPYMEITYTK